MRALRTGLLVLGVLMAAAVHAQLQYFGFTLRDANLRAGPAREYPLVAPIPPGAVVQIVGCLDAWRWCEVAWGGARGFVYAGLLGYPWESGYVIVRDGGPWLGLPVVAFAVEPYWGTWYVDRPWYPQWSHWVSRPVHRPPGRPPQHPPTVHPMPASVQRATPGIVPPMGHPVPSFQAGRPEPPQPRYRVPSVERPQPR
jgi:uncharacterized protein YraI